MTATIPKFRYLTHSPDSPTATFPSGYQVPVKKIPKGTVLFTYYNDSVPAGTPEDKKGYHLTAAFYARTGQFQSIRFDNVSNKFIICFSSNQKPLFFFSFPGLGKGVLGREYTTIVPVIVKKDINIAHLRSGTVYADRVKRKGDKVVNGVHTKMDKCSILVQALTACSDGYENDTCFGYDYKLANYIDGLSNIDFLDYIHKTTIVAGAPVPDFGPMKNALKGFHNYGTNTAGKNTVEFKQMWETMLLGICSDINATYRRIGYEEYALFPPYGYYGLNMDTIPNSIAGVVAERFPAAGIAVKKTFKVTPENFSDFLSEVQGLAPAGGDPYCLLEPMMPIHTGGVYDDVDWLGEHELLNSREKLYNLNLHVWNYCKANFGLNYLVNWNILVTNETAVRFEANKVHAQPWLQKQYLEGAPPEVGVVRKNPNPFMFRKLDTLENIKNALRYKLRKISAGERRSYRSEPANGVDIANQLHYIDYRDSGDLIQIGPFRDLFRIRSWNKTLIPAVDTDDSLVFLRDLLGDLEAGSGTHSYFYDYLRTPANLAALRQDAHKDYYAKLSINVGPGHQYAQFGGSRLRRSTRRKSRHSNDTFINSNMRKNQTMRNNRFNPSPRNNSQELRLSNTVSLQPNVRNFTRNNKAVQVNLNAKKMNLVTPVMESNRKNTDSETMADKVSFFPENLSSEVKKVLRGPNPPSFIKQVQERIAKQTAAFEEAKAALAKINPKD